MPARRRQEIATLLRERIERGVSTRALIRGDRLPSTREMGKEMGVDPRTIAAAYHTLAAEGLVELRLRSGVYITPQTMVDAGDRAPSPVWLAKVLGEGIQDGFSTRELCDHLREAALGRKLRAVVIAETLDQTAGICSELRLDYGLEVTGLLARTLKRGAPIPNAVRRAHLLVTTAAHRERVNELARALGKVFVLADIRSEVFGEWETLLRREVFVIGTDPRFLAMLERRLATVPGGKNVTLLVAGRDDLSRISRGAPTYVTQAARDVLGKTRIPGRLIAPTRLLDSRSVDQLLSAIVGINTASR